MRASLRHLRRAAFFTVLTVPGEAFAAGGSHVVDDAGVETPGVCHLESWGTRLGRGGGAIVPAPACTRRTWDRLEIGGFLQRTVADGAVETTIGPALKLALSRDDAPVRVGVLATATIRGRNGRVEGGSVIVPVTFALGERATANINIGYVRTRIADRHASFAGVQVERALTDKLGVMVEAFGRDRGKPGFQAGLRWTPLRWVDVDLLAGSRTDGASPRTFTLGVTVRR